MSVKVYLYDLTGRPQDAEEWDTVETLQGWLVCHNKPYTREEMVPQDEGYPKPEMVAVPGKTFIYPAHRVARVEQEDPAKAETWA